MAEITLVRQSPEEITDADRMTVRRVLFGIVDGLGELNRKRWRRTINKLLRLEVGECATLKDEAKRSLPYHKRHFAIEQRLFENQERFNDFKAFRYWLKVGAGWVTWAVGPKGGVIPIPRSVSYAECDQAEFQEFHAQVIEFLRGPHAAKYLWPHLTERQAGEMMNSILEGFQE